ncbi:MAG: septum formation protein Maf [Clostridia bacterium]|nr:septum formation protein Maf [Clostridia bacterium]
MRVILASKSPRRKEILETLGVKFEIRVADADESSDVKDPELLVQALAQKKGRAVLEGLEDKNDCLLIACDTLVYAEGEFLGKPKDVADATRMMRMLSGKAHIVVSGLYLYYDGREVGASAVTKVCFDQLSDSEIEDYVNTSEPYDKAGGYAVQGLAGKFVKGIEGDYFNVVGLPVNLLYRTLKEQFGLDIQRL